MTQRVGRGQRILLDERSQALRDELRASLGASAEQLRAHRERGTQTDVTDLKTRLELLGFGGEAQQVADLLPLIYVAWADGSVSRKERETIFEILETRGLHPESRSWKTIAALLDQRPSETWIDESLEVLRVLLAGRDASAEGVVGLCVAVADASGGIFGLGNRIDASERQALTRIAEALGDSASAALAAKMR